MLDANWLNALKLPTKVLIGLFIASIILLALDKVRILDLSIFTSVAEPIVIIICVMSGALSFTAVTSFFINLISARIKRTLFEQRRDLRKKEKREEQNVIEQKILERILHLSKNELHYLADCLRENSQSFTTYVHSPPASMLMSKKLIYTPGGTHHQDHYPFVVYDFVWKYLLESRGEIIAQDEENKKIEKRR